MQSTAKKVSPDGSAKISFRRVFRLFAIVGMFMMIGSLLPLAATGNFCCLDDWQGGGVCPPGQRLASYCSGGTWACENCGTFFCVTEGNRPPTVCYH